MTTVDIKTAALARDAAKAFAGLDTRGVASVAETLRGFESAAKLVDMSAVREAAKAFEATRPIVGPQIGSQIADALAAMGARNAAFAEAFRRMGPPKFNFMKTLDDVTIASQLQPRVGEAFAAWAMPPAFSTAVSEALGRVSAGAGADDLAPRAAQAVTSAVALAETPSAAEFLDETLVGLDDLSPAERRELQRDVVDAVAALGTIVAILARDGRIELASATLALVAILVSIYWRTTRTLDS